MLRNIIRKIILEAFDFDYNKTFTPPSNVSMAAKKALQAIEGNNLTSKGTNVGSGKQKATELANNVTHNYNMMRRLKSYFDTHKAKYDNEINSGKNITSSGIIQAWELHGGDAAYSWVSSSLGSMRSSNLNTKKNLRKAGGAGTNKGMGIFNTKIMDTTNTRVNRE